MRTFLILILIFIGFDTIGQGKWNVKSDVNFERYSYYKGTIDGKYPISMRIEETNQSCAELVSRWTPRLVYGWYSYQKIGKKIPLVGHTCYADACETSLELFVPNDPIDYEFDENCNMSNFKEKFTIMPGSDQMTWTLLGKEPVPVELDAIHTFSWKTDATLSLSINEQNIAIFDLNKIAKNEYIEQIDIIAQKRVNKLFHVIIKYSHQSNPGSFGHGACGAGIEEYIGYLKIDQNFSLIKFDQIQSQSCINSIYEAEINYDIQRPELGISH